MPSLSVAKNDSSHISCRSDVDLIETKTNIPADLLRIKSSSEGPMEPSNKREKYPSGESHFDEREKIHVDEKMKRNVDKDADSSTGDNESTCNGTSNDSKSSPGTGSTSKVTKESQIKDESAKKSDQKERKDHKVSNRVDDGHTKTTEEQSEDGSHPGDIKDNETRKKSAQLEGKDSAYNDEQFDGDEDSKKDQAQMEHKTKHRTKNKERSNGTETLNDTKKDEVGEHTDSIASDTSGNDVARSDTKKEKKSNSNSKSNNSDGRSHVGRKGDPRMHASVAAKINNPTLKLYEALIQGGFEYEADKDADKDDDGVTLVQRKNQLRRRLRKLNIPRDNKFTKKLSLSPIEESNTKTVSHKITDQPFDKPVFPMSMYYQPPHMMHMPQQFGYNMFPPTTRTSLPGPTEKDEDKSTTQSNGDTEDPKTNNENQKESKLNENGESKSSQITPNPHKLPDYPLPPFYPPQSTFGFPPFHLPYPMPPPGYNFEENKEATNDTNGDSSSLADDTEKNSNETEARESSSSNANDKLKLNKSCDRCRRRKVKCDGNDPCNVCVNDRARLRKKTEKQNKSATFNDDYDFGIECCYSYSMKRGPPAGRNKKRKRKGNSKDERNIKPSKSPFPGINMPQGGPSMVPPHMMPPHMMPFYGQFTPPSPMMNNMQQPNVPTSPQNPAPFGMNYPPYPFPFTNNPVTDGIYSQAILAAARSVLIPPGSKSDDADNEKKNESSSSSSSSKDTGTKHCLV